MIDTADNTGIHISQTLMLFSTNLNELFHENLAEICGIGDIECVLERSVVYSMEGFVIHRLREVNKTNFLGSIRCLSRTSRRSELIENLG